MKRLITSVGILAIAASAFASWNVTIGSSNGVLNPPSTPVTVPTIVQSNPVPQITFLTAAATPNPLMIGLGTGFSSGSFFGQYTIQDPTNTKPYLNGFNFVIAGYVFDFGTITWFKKVVRNSDNAILWQDSGAFYGDAYSGGVDGAFSVVIPVSLAVPANDVTVYETFQLTGGGRPGSGAGLMLVEQDWTVVPEPASMIALATGLGGLLLRRRKA
ncbi:MAG: PEP-CTERM sorting domain-containing protein [Fimbriimonadales bacterium]|nr:PEP-CTERM sorting domain-containing protein [Fimbriimonadales bacterium]